MSKPKSKTSASAVPVPKDPAAGARAVHQSRTPEERSTRASALASAGWAKRTPEERTVRATRQGKARWAGVSPEDRRKYTAKIRAAHTAKCACAVCKRVRKAKGKSAK